MRFAEPDLLSWLIILPIGVLVVWSAKRAQGRALASVGHLDMLRQLMAGVNENGRLWRTRLWFVALALIIFAMARPQWGTEVTQVEQEGVQMMVVLDISPSMLAEDVRPNRLFLAKQTIIELMNLLGGDEVGLVLFSGASFIQFPLTSDYNTAQSFLDNAHPRLISRAGTVLGDAINTAVHGFDPQRASQKVIVILTDGESHDDDPIFATNEAVEQGVIVYTIGFGSPDGEPVPIFDNRGQLLGYKQDQLGNLVLSRLNEGMLEEIAEAGNGRYFRATSRGDEITELAGELDNLQQAQLASSFETTHVERYQLFLAAAIVLLILAELIPEKKRGYVV